MSNNSFFLFLVLGKPMRLVDLHSRHDHFELL